MHPQDLGPVAAASRRRTLSTVPTLRGSELQHCTVDNHAGGTSSSVSVLVLCEVIIADLMRKQHQQRLPVPPLYRPPSPQPSVSARVSVSKLGAFTRAESQEQTWERVRKIALLNSSALRDPSRSLSTKTCHRSAERVRMHRCQDSELASLEASDNVWICHETWSDH